VENTYRTTAESWSDNTNRSDEFDVALVPCSDPPTGILTRAHRVIGGDEHVRGMALEFSRNLSPILVPRVWHHRSSIHRGTNYSRVACAVAVRIFVRMDTVRWGIIGCGDVTEIKSGPGFTLAEGSELVAVMRRDGAKAADYAKRHSVARWYDDGAKLIADPDVNAIYVATPPDAHEDYTRLAAQVGKPVYVEKPMARTYDECKRMVHLCRQGGSKLFVAYYRRSLPRFLKVKELLENRAIGHVRMVNVRLYQPTEKADHDPAKLPWRVIPDIAGAGKFLDLASHTLDLLDFLLGPVNRVSGFAQNQAGLYPAEDVVAGSWVHDGGTVGSGFWCFTTHHREDVVELIGDRGRIRFGTFGADQPVLLESESESEEFAIDHPPHIQQPMIQAIVNELRGVGGMSPSTGETAARTSWVMDEMLRGWRSLRIR